MRNKSIQMLQIINSLAADNFSTWTKYYWPTFRKSNEIVGSTSKEVQFPSPNWWNLKFRFIHLHLDHSLKSWIHLEKLHFFQWPSSGLKFPGAVNNLKRGQSYKLWEDKETHKSHIEINWNGLNCWRISKLKAVPLVEIPWCC